MCEALIMTLKITVPYKQQQPSISFIALEISGGEKGKEVPKIKDLI